MDGRGRSGRGRGSCTVEDGLAGGRGPWTVEDSLAGGRGSWAVEDGLAGGRGSWVVEEGLAGGRGFWTVEDGLAGSRGSWVVEEGLGGGRKRRRTKRSWRSLWVCHRWTMFEYRCRGFFYDRLQTNARDGATTTILVEIDYFKYVVKV